MGSDFLQTEVLSLQPMIIPKRFDIFFPLTAGCLDAFRFYAYSSYVKYCITRYTVHRYQNILSLKYSTVPDIYAVLLCFYRHLGE